MPIAAKSITTASKKAPNFRIFPPLHVFLIITHDSTKKRIKSNFIKCLQFFLHYSEGGTRNADFIAISL